MPITPFAGPPRRQPPRPPANFGLDDDTAARLNAYADEHDLDADEVMRSVAEAHKARPVDWDARYEAAADQAILLAAAREAAEAAREAAYQARKAQP